MQYSSSHTDETIAYCNIYSTNNSIGPKCLPTSLCYLSAISTSVNRD
jgi:hypothetical protein